MRRAPSSSTPRRARAPNLSPAWLGARPPRGAHPADRGAHLHVRRCVVRHDRGRRAVYLVSGDKQSPWRQPSNGACAGTHRTTHAGQPMLLQQPLGAKRRARAPLLAARIFARYGRCSRAGPGPNMAAKYGAGPIYASSSSRMEACGERPTGTVSYRGPATTNSRTRVQDEGRPRARAAVRRHRDEHS